MKKLTFTNDAMEDLRALLTTPPEAPRPTSVTGVRNLLAALAPQLRALTKAGYDAEQIAEFFGRKDIQIKPEQIRSAVAPRRPQRQAAKPAVTAD